MQTKVINLFEIKYKNMLNINMGYDKIYIANKRRDIKHEMIKGYMELLTAQVNKNIKGW
ncbi:hypothetical protein ABEV41_00660 [Geobacillus thermodenitrificans]|jgi:hypothetical protein|uniref:hypothetical protein n=1 Tax=Geobacillus thermodenitrificans TaxID=33940 RepID=UPI003D1CE13D